MKQRCWFYAQEKRRPAPTAPTFRQAGVLLHHTHPPSGGNRPLLVPLAGGPGRAAAGRPEAGVSSLQVLSERRLHEGQGSPGRYSCHAQAQNCTDVFVAFNISPLFFSTANSPSLNNAESEDLSGFALPLTASKHLSFSLKPGAMEGIGGSAEAEACSQE